jgi:hypothetical protein
LHVYIETSRVSTNARKRIQFNERDKLIELPERCSLGRGSVGLGKTLLLLLDNELKSAGAWAKSQASLLTALQSATLNVFD